jgi:hypothetical protein
MPVSYRQKWMQEYTTNVKGMARNLAHENIWEHYDKWTISDGHTGHNLYFGLHLMLGNRACETARAMMLTALEIAGRIWREDKLREGESADFFPTNRGKLVHRETYVRALLGQGFDRVRLVDACMDIVDGEDSPGAKGKSPDWRQSDRLCAVRLALIAGRRDLTRKLLKKTGRMTFNSHGEEHAILLDLASSFERYPLRDPGRLAKFDVFFDRIRNPDYRGRRGPQGPVFEETEVHMIDVAVVRYLFLEDQDRPIDWNLVLDMLGQ